MNILMTGGTGFIGGKLIEKLVEEGNHVYVLTRHPKYHQDTEYVSFISYQFPIKRLPFIHAMINLAGESLFGYWSPKKKEAIITSRVQATEALIRMLAQMEKKPDVFISASAIGYYGTSEETIFTEATTDYGKDFLSTVAATWERTAKVAEDFGIRTVYTRFGVVLDKHKGALPLMALPISLFVGGPIGTGNQWISWIHIEDCIQLLLHCLHNKKIVGPVNITAPHPKRNKEFTQTLATIKKRPSFMYTPNFLLKTVLGDLHQLITEGQYVLPQKALDNQFTFKYDHLEDALREIYQK